MSDAPKFCTSQHHHVLKSQTLEIFRAGTEPGWYEERPEEVDEDGHWPATKTEFALCKVCTTTLSYDVIGLSNYTPRVKDERQRQAELAELGRALAGHPGAGRVVRLAGQAAESSPGPGGGEENPFRSHAHDSWCSCHR